MPAPTLPRAIREASILVLLSDRTGFFVVLHLDPGNIEVLACPECCRALAFAVLEQHEAAGGLTWSYRCIHCGRQPKPRPHLTPAA